MNAFHLFTRFTLWTCLSISMFVMLNGRVEDIRSVDIKSEDQNRELVFSHANRDWLIDSQDYFVNNDYLQLAPNGLSSSSGLDEDAAKWDIYTDGEGIPTWAMNNVSNPSLDGRSLRCAITGGDPYSNVHCYRNLPAEPTSNFFTLSMSFYYQPASSFNNAGEPSIVQGLEFTMNKWDQGLRYEWALQWDNVDTGAPKWRYWDPAHLPKWVDLGISGEVKGEEWHTLILEGEILEGKVHYRRFVFDNQPEYQLNIPLVATAITPSEPDKLAVAAQLDGNSTETPYELFIDHVTLTSSDTVGATVINTLRANSNPTNLTSADFTVAFSETVTGVDVTDFTLTTTGVSGATVSGVSGSGSSYTVTVSTGSGNGNIRLDVLDNDTILDVALNPLVAGFTSGEIYTVIKSATFTDVPLDYWANSYIERLYNAGITGGCGTGIYCPDSTVTRAQMAVFLLKGMHGSGFTPPAVGTSTGFTDVAIDYWAAAWIKQLAAEGITGGCGTGIYCPDATVTRAQMAIFLLKAKHGTAYSPPTATGVFTDVPVGYWADKWIEQLAVEGITGGCGAGTYCPDSSVTRAQMAVFLVKTFNLP